MNKFKVLVLSNFRHKYTLISKLVSNTLIQSRSYNSKNAMNA